MLHPFTEVNYGAVDALWVLTVYYNPCKYKSRRGTYDAFMKTMKQSGINVLTVECAFGDDEFDLPESHDVIKVRSKSLLWQKERLLNIGSMYLPKSCKYVAWIDCDVIFTNPHWAAETALLLEDKCTIVQLFTTCLRLDKGNKVPRYPEPVESFASVTNRDVSTIECGRYDHHGHTGYAWAMRREIFDAIGLYEHCVTGSADHFMSHAIYNHYGFCIINAVKKDPNQIRHITEWGNLFYKHVQGKLGTVSGQILHLWHGSLDRRDYFDRMWKVTEYGYNPEKDFLAMPGKPLEWMPHVRENKPRLVEYFAEYFESRAEDEA